MSYQSLIANNKKWIDDTFQSLDKKLRLVSVRSRDKIPYTTTDGVHSNIQKDKVGREGITWWTNGFFGGLMWLMHEATGEACYKIAAKSSEKILDEAFLHPEGLHHDVGFQWHILSGASYRLTGDEASLERVKRAADMLRARYNEKGEYIVAWNGEEHAGWTIIDTMMNLPLLYFASKQFGDESYMRVAKIHADMAMREHVRADGSVNHIVNHTRDRVGVIETLGGQGYGVGSCWSRGSSWAIYGFVLAYIHTGEVAYLDTAKRAAHYFISSVSETDYLPLVDFRAPSEPVEYDTTAGAIAAAGLIEIAKAVPEFEGELYLSAAIKILRAMAERFCDFDENTDGVLMNGVERYLSEPKNIIYGDYYFTEAILKLRGSKFLPW
ncbi:MAG: glycoside hydrolase family 88 protein [Clostridia bacterium]|nr:glycoside hydrolase family 88 protein [Clostridia bacterium]